MPDPWKRLYRIQTVTRFQGQLMQNVFHVGTKDLLLTADVLAGEFYNEVCMQIMSLQVYYVTYEALLVTCLEPDWPEYLYYDLEFRRPPLDVIALPSPVAWKWTSRNISNNRNTIGGFYMGGLISSHWAHSGRLSDEGQQTAQHVKGQILTRVGVGGIKQWTIGTYSRTLRKKFPQIPLHSCFFGWSQLNYNTFYTSMRKRVPGIGL